MFSLYNGFRIMLAKVIANTTRADFKQVNATIADKGWGKLKSGAGWISLDFCTRI